MSQLEFVKVIDPRLDYNARQNSAYTVVTGGVNQDWKRYISQNFSNNYIGFNCPPPNASSVINNKIYIELKYILTFKGASGGLGQALVQMLGARTNPGVPSGTGYYDAPRCLPMSQIIQNQQIQINNDSVNTNLYQYSRVFQRYGRNKHEENIILSGSPAMPDKTQTYGELDGLALNPLNGYGNNTSQDARGAFRGVKILTNSALGANDEAKVELTIFEPLWLSPFYTGSADDNNTVGLTQIYDFQMTLNVGGRGQSDLGGLASSLWSHSEASPSTLTTVTADLQYAHAYFNYITPNPNYEIPRTINYPYFEPVIYQTQNKALVAPGDYITFDSQTMQLKLTPPEFYIFVGRSDATCDISSTDTFFNIENVNLTYNNNPGIMANMDPYSLYQMSVDNGLTNCSWDDWQYRQGSVVCCRVGLDVPLTGNNAPGKGGLQTLQIKVRAKNISSQAIDPTLTIFIVQEGVLTIRDQIVSRSLGVITDEDIKDAKSDAQTQAKYAKSKRVFGGNFIDDIGKFFKNAFRPIMDNLGPLLSTLGPEFAVGTKIADDIGKSYGLGLDGESYGLGLGTQRGKKGGELMTKNKLKYLK